MKLNLSKIFRKGGRVPQKALVDAAGRRQAALWMATTVVFALLFFLSSVLDMKVKVTFGQTDPTSSSTQATPARTTTPGIASQVGGC